MAATALLLLDPAAAHADVASSISGLNSDLNSDVGVIPGLIGAVWSGAANAEGSVNVGNSQINPNVKSLGDDTFRIGSLTKSFTATVLLQLEAENRLSINDPVDNYLPGLIQAAPAGSSGITYNYSDPCNGSYSVTTKNTVSGSKIRIKDLLDQHSGLPDYTGVDGLISWPGAAPHTPLELVGKAMTQTASSAPTANPAYLNGIDPGFNYTDTNYIVAGLIITKVTCHDPGVEITNRILTPLGMVNSSYPTTSTMVGSKFGGDMMHGYAHIGWPRLPLFGVQDVSNSDPTQLGAAAAMISNTGDLLTYYRALLGGQLLQPTQLEEMKTIAPAAASNNIPWTGYGLGIAQTSSPCGPVWFHTGDVWGYHSMFVSNDDGSKLVVVNANEFSDNDFDTSWVPITAQAEKAFCAL